jgi:hypothetical protein
MADAFNASGPSVWSSSTLCRARGSSAKQHKARKGALWKGHLDEAQQERGEFAPSVDVLRVLAVGQQVV